MPKSVSFSMMRKFAFSQVHRPHLVCAVLAVVGVVGCNAASTRGGLAAALQADESNGVHGTLHTCIHDEVHSRMPAPELAAQGSHGPAAGPIVHPLGGRALASTHCGNEYCPMRITWEEYDMNTGGDLTPARKTLLVDTIMPAAVERMNSMYLVKPVAGNLLMSRKCNAYCSGAADPRRGKCSDYTRPAQCSLGDGSAPVDIPDKYYGEQVEGCGVSTNTLPPPTATPGRANSDFHIFVRAEDTTSCAGGSTLAYAGTCQRDEDTDRPTVGVVNFCPDRIDTDPATLRGQVYTAIHELHHAIGFSSGAWPLFRDAGAGGSPRTPRDSVQPHTVSAAYRLRAEQDLSSGVCTPTSASSPPPGKQIVTVQTAESGTVAYFSERGISECTDDADKLQNGNCVTRMVTSEAVAKGREFFNCPSLPGVELENQRTSSACAVVGSHLEQRVFMQNFMAPVTSHHSVITPVEMGIMQDSGWYIANYSSADALSAEWGFQQGCAFATEQCLQAPKSAPVNVATAQGRDHFCTRYTDANSHQACTVDHRAVGACSATDGNSIPAEFSYFTDVTVGSVSPIQTDFCPYIKGFSNRLCSDTSQNSADSRKFGRLYSDDSRCAVSTLLKQGLSVGSHTGVGCFTKTCAEAPLSPSELSVIAGTDGLPPPSPTAPWLLLGAADPDTTDVHYAACVNGSTSINPKPSVFSGEFTCLDPALFCKLIGSSTPLVLPTPSPSPSVGASPGASPGPGSGSSGAGGLLGTGIDEQYIYYGAGALGLIIALACLWQCCCRSKQDSQQATSGGRYEHGQGIQMQVRPSS